jgi:hypothetical protein
MARSRRRRVLAAVFASFFALALPAGMVLAGTLTLHPSGFGEKSRANWKAMEGRPDSTGSGNQALYMQKMVPTSQVAAGVAVVKGFEGEQASVLDGLSWEHRTDSHCGAGAPRWVLGVRGSSGPTRNVFLGCNEAVHNQTDTRWCKDSFSANSIDAHVVAAGGSPSDEIRYLLILFDEGPDNPNTQPAGCTPPGPDPNAEFAGFVYLDNIEVVSTVGTRTWTSAADNGNGPTAFFGPSVALADELPSASDILAILEEAFPGVPLTSFVLYPNVEPADVPVPGLP